MTDLQIFPDDTKQQVFKKVEKYLAQFNFTITLKNEDPPWGGFFAIADSDIQLFISTFFSGLSTNSISQYDRLSPKILLVAPQKRLSWQYHLRRAEVWCLLYGTASIIVSPDDRERTAKVLQYAQSVEIKCGERHRLIGLNNWGIVAEIWKHTDKDKLSNENDIVRLADDFGR